MVFDRIGTQAFSICCFRNSRSEALPSWVHDFTGVDLDPDPYDTSVLAGTASASGASYTGRKINVTISPDLTTISVRCIILDSIEAALEITVDGTGFISNRANKICTPAEFGSSTEYKDISSYLSIKHLKGIDDIARAAWERPTLEEWQTNLKRREGTWRTLIAGHACREVLGEYKRMYEVLCGRDFVPPETPEIWSSARAEPWMDHYPDCPRVRQYTAPFREAIAEILIYRAFLSTEE